MIQKRMRKKSISGLLVDGLKKPKTNLFGKKAKEKPEFLKGEKGKVLKVYFR